MPPTEQLMDKNDEILTLQAQIDILKGNVVSLLNEKRQLETANANLAEHLKRALAEICEHERRFKELSGMGIQTNQPDTFKELKNG